MKQFAIIGIGRFSRRMLEELADAGCEILLIDKDREVVDLYKDKVAATFIADVLSEEVIKKLVPASVDAAIVDLGDNLEASILVTNYLKKLGVGRIITKAESEQHAEILDLVGATDIIFPNREAARRIAPLLLSSLLFSYLPISRDFAIAEIKVPGKYVGKTLIEANLRQQHHMNVIALRKDSAGEYTYFLPDYRLQADDLLLVAGKEDDITEFAQTELPAVREGIPGVFNRLFSRFRTASDQKDQK
jgi:trk system potassium uptake protein TrkA